MPGTFSDSWKLTKTAFRLIREDRALLVFPVVAGLAIVGVLAILAAGMFYLVLPPYTDGSLAEPYVGLIVVAFVAAYFLMSFLAVYCTAALVGAATLKLNGQQPSATDGWRVARSRLGRLIVWSILTATVGLAIQAISSRVRGVGGLLIAGIGGASWAIATYFILPVILYEDLGAWRSLARSARLFLSTFGRSFISNAVVGLLITLGVVVAFLLGLTGLAFLGTSVYLGIGMLVVAIGVGAVVVLIGATAEGILRAALYRYATTGKVDPDLLPPAYRTAQVPVSPPLP